MGRLRGLAIRVDEKFRRNLARIIIDEEKGEKI